MERQKGSMKSAIALLLSFVMAVSAPCFPVLAKESPGTEQDGILLEEEDIAEDALEEGGAASEQGDASDEYAVDENSSSEEEDEAVFEDAAFGEGADFNGIDEEAPQADDEKGKESVNSSEDDAGKGEAEDSLDGAPSGLSDGSAAGDGVNDGIFGGEDGVDAAGSVHDGSEIIPEEIPEEAGEVDDESVAEEAAMAAVSSPLDLAASGVTGDVSGNGYYWNNEDKILTLRNGFEMDLTNPGSSALRLRAGTTILLEGRATIRTNQMGIEALGNLTVRSAEGANGFLDIAVSGTGTNGNYYYGIQMENLEGRENRTLTVTDNAIVRINGGKRCIFCNDGLGNSTNLLARLVVTDSSAVRLEKGSGSEGIAAGFHVRNAQRLIWQEGSGAPALLAEDVQKAIDNQNQVSMLSFGLEGTADNNKTLYTLTYDGKEHPVVVNTDEQTLAGIGLGTIRIEPVNFSYDESTCSEYTGGGSDYRDKELVPTRTQYQSFTAASGAPQNAAVYNIKYGSTQIVRLQIARRRVVVEGLAALDKTYDGWPDAQIDYSGMTLHCVNDTNSGTLDQTGILAADQERFGDEILPWAKAYFLTEPLGSASGADYVAADGKAYKKSADVAYTGTGTSAQKKVTSKKVRIEEISLSDPNYEVVMSSPSTNPTSQNEAQASIYPRALASDTVSCVLSPTSVRYRESGYSEEKDFYKTIRDTSPVTPLHPEKEYALEADTDYLVNPNTNTVTEVGDYEIILTGQGNYTGTRRLGWSLLRARRKVEISLDGSAVYDGAPVIAAPAGAGGILSYSIKDTDNGLDLTESLEEGSNLRIMYSGTKADGSAVEETLDAPKDAGSYTVEISVDETTRYTAASASFEYVINPKIVEAEWRCAGGSVQEAQADPKELVFNGTPNVFSAEVTNAVEGDEVLVTQIEYEGRDTGGRNYSHAQEAPKNAGAYTVRALEVSNANYSVGNSAGNAEGTPWHTYEVKPAGAWLTWEDDGAEFTYDTSDHTPAAAVHGLCMDEDGTEDICHVKSWRFAGTDVFGKAYTKAGGAVNASGAQGVTITATSLDNPNYELTEEEGSLSASFAIKPLDLSSLAVGASAASGEIWAERVEYDGSIQEPVIRWGKDGLGAALVKGTDYTASSSTTALEHNENGLVITVDGKGNYQGRSIVPWNVDKISASISLTGMGAAFTEKGDHSYSAVYGDDGYDAPAFTYTFVNEDIEKNHEVTADSYVSVHYTGTVKNGASYDSNAAPTQAGEYTAVATLAETDHYWAGTDAVDFVILPREAKVTGGVSAIDKAYDGATAAVADFSASEWAGILDRDKDNVRQALSGEPSADSGPVSYEAAFETKNVRLDDAAAGSSDPENILAQTVTVGSLRIRYTDPAAGVLANYEIAQDQAALQAQAKILPRKVAASGITARNKVYDGNDEAELAVTGLALDGVLTGEKLTIPVIGTFLKTGDENGGKDVLLKAGEPVAKAVSIRYGAFKAANLSTEAANYVLDEENSQKETQAVISPATLKVNNLRTKDRFYDGTAEAELDWENAQVGGSCDGALGLDAEKAVKTITFDSTDVQYSRKGAVTDQTGTVSSEGLSITGAALENYVFSEISFRGRILPKPLSDIVWTFDDQNLSQIPVASFGEESGILDQDAGNCEPVVQFYLASDTEFRLALKESALDDDVDYVAKATGTTNGNYGIEEDGPNVTRAFRFDSRKNPVTLTFTNYLRSDGQPFTVTYGEPLPVPALEDDNADLAEATQTEKAGYLSIRYLGKTLSGNTYDSDQMPTQAGTYKVSAQLAETGHFLAAAAEAGFVIAPRQVRIIQGMQVSDKYYNGTKKAILSFENAVFDGFLASDEAECAELLTKESTDYIRYTALYNQSHVAYKEELADGGSYAARSVADIAVAVSGLSFILREGTPELLYNYTIAEKGNQSGLYGKILPRPVTVSGIKAENKAYDGKSAAKLDLSKVKLSGKIKGETLGVEVSGRFAVTGDEKLACDVLTDEKGNTLKKDVLLTIKRLYAADEKTKAGDYFLVKEGQQEKATAKVLPVQLTSVVWKIDSKVRVPYASLSRAGGIVNSADMKQSAGLDVVFYEKKDTAFSKPVLVSKMKAGTAYAARIEGFDNKNYKISNQLKKKTYTFTYSEAGQNEAARELNKGLSLAWKDGILLVKWGAASGADGYYVGAGPVDQNYTTRRVSKARKSTGFNAEDNNSVYRAYVRAYRVLNGKKIFMGKSLLLQCAADGLDGYNALKVTVKKASVTVKVKESVSAEASVSVLKDGKTVKMTGKASGLRYWSTDPSVASVSADGKITGKKKGACQIYAMAKNGKKKAVNVTVE